MTLLVLVNKGSQMLVMCKLMLLLCYYGLLYRVETRSSCLRNLVILNKRQDYETKNIHYFY